jgi:hypothetical protein
MALLCGFVFPALWGHARPRNWDIPNSQTQTLSGEYAKMWVPIAKQPDLRMLAEHRRRRVFRLTARKLPRHWYHK